MFNFKEIKSFTAVAAQCFQTDCQFGESSWMDGAENDLKPIMYIN